MKNLLRYTFVIALGVVFGTASVFAQQQQMPQQPQPLSPEEVSDEDLQMVSDISTAAQSIQQEADEKVRAIVEEQGMEFSRFQQIAMAQRNPQMAGQVNITEEEQKKLETVQPELMKVGQEAQQQYMQTIQEEGMTVQRFQRVAQSIQAHPEVAERFEEINGEGEEGGSEN
ncbi:DUF4168 domain-containing protein [Gracilimonas mengyeensis]|uniref:DUF4168 domain-containing protein n=1 Tax=Gracilimonas mengyeensis TaxID=1302730 RepID=A0A521F9R2_9BACT|nr:DUF4168 domain-containing protein [Gracilimonas mengyeensis]SMO92952.1 protein of unknown function [Gracilimonas mengyeensis]